MTEERLAELLASADTLSWHLAFMLRYGLNGADRDHHAARFVRTTTLRCVGTALIEGYDGGELAPKPRNAAEHRVGDIYLGSVLLRECDRFDGFDWWRVEQLLTPLVVGKDETPPLQRATA